MFISQKKITVKKTHHVPIGRTKIAFFFTQCLHALRHFVRQLDEVLIRMPVCFAWSRHVHISQILCALGRVCGGDFVVVKRVIQSCPVSKGARSQFTETN